LSVLRDQSAELGFISAGDRQGIHFTLHFSGTLLITGIKGHKDLEDVVYPTILELSVCL
jgi:hypothetical protein